MHSWKPVAPSGSSGKSAAGSPRQKELYFGWAEATQWRGFARSNGWDVAKPGECHLRVIACTREQATLEKLLGMSERAHIHPLYLQLPPGAVDRPSYFTANLTLANLRWIAKQTLPGLRWELAMPLRRPEDVTEGSRAGEYGGTMGEGAMAAERIFNPPPPTLKNRVEKPLDRAIAVIDYGCPVLHEQLRDESGRSRVRTLWDQDPARRWWLRSHLQKPQKKGAVAQPLVTDPWWCLRGDEGDSSPEYGRVLSSGAIEHLQSVAGARSDVDEADAYRSIDYLINRANPRRRAWYATHGAHVLDVAAGRLDPLAPECDDVDAAGRAPIVFVQLPGLTAADSSGGSLAAHVLDGVRYAMAQCEPHAPLVVNLSYGSYAGPHDGSSMLECALDDLLHKRPENFAIVLAAGNARQSDCHARRVVSRDRSALLRVYLPPEDTTDTFVELWYPRPASPRLRMRVRTPARAWSDWVQPGSSVQLRDPAAGTDAPGVVAMLQHEHVVMHGGQAMALLAVAPTAPATDDVGPLAEAGVWEIEVALIGNKGEDITFDAWVERDDPGYRGIPGATEQPRFLGLRRGDERNTLSSLATGRHTLVAAGFRADTGKLPGYVSLPAEGVLPGNLLVARCEDDDMLPSVRAAAVRSADSHRMNGTSVAAPVLARQVFKELVARGSTQGERAWRELLASIVSAGDGRIRWPVIEPATPTGDDAGPDARMW